MRELMFGEFAKYQVLPLDASVATRAIAPRPGLAFGRKEFVYSGHPVTGIINNAAPNLLNTSYTITAEIDVPENAEGVIVTEGGRFGGYGLYLMKGKPTFTWNLLGLKRVKWQAPDSLAAGKHTLVFDFKYDGLGVATLAFNNVTGLGRSGTGSLSVDGKVSRPRPWSERSRSFYHGTRPSTSARTPVRESTTPTIRSRSPSPARLIS